VIALALRDAGAEVIYTGLRKSPDFIVRVALDEDVAAVGLSILSGSHQELAPVLEGLRAAARATSVFIAAPFRRRTARLVGRASRACSPHRRWRR
jgi:methylmalonyl-CoA mutase cobalamin-binding domain/chain